MAGLVDRHRADRHRLLLLAEILRQKPRRARQVSRETMPSLVIDDVTKDYGAFRAIKWRQPLGRAGRVHRHGRPVRLREVDAASRHRRARADHGRADRHQRPRRHRLEPADRGVAMVFQNYALYPHMTVAQNMGFGLKMAGRPTRRGRCRGAARRGDPPHHRASRQAAEASFPAARSSASPSAAPSRARPRSSSSTSRCRTSTPRSAAQMRVELAGSTPSSRRPWSTSRTTRPRR